MIRNAEFHVEDAVDVGDHGEQILAVEDAACRVNGGYVIDARVGLGRVDVVRAG